MFECYDYTSDDYIRASAIEKQSVSEVRVGICFFMFHEESNINYVSDQLSFTPSEISFDCSASAYDMAEAVKASMNLKRDLMRCYSYEEVKSCFKKYGLNVCDDESFASTLDLDDQTCEEVARYGWGSCIVSFAAYGVFEGLES